MQLGNDLAWSRHLILAGGACVSAWSSVQMATALSTFEAELYALVLTVRVLIAMRQLAEFLLGRALRPSFIYCDNQSAIIFLRRRDLSARARHIRVHLGFIYDAIDSGCFHFRFVRSKQNPANSLTAAEDEERFYRSVMAFSGADVRAGA